MSDKLKISVMVNLPEPTPKSEECCDGPSKLDLLSEKICEYIDICESNVLESEHEWCYLKAIYPRLVKKPLPPKLKEAVMKIEDLFIKNAGREKVPLDSGSMISLKGE
jgi:hypothetical protein